ncbi:Hypothetical protein NTJ_03829 [Nesidiocoris tenuis]|uniref:Uncharacterized protein n=1 Tax=Nesidiocoris tenuis TaxID=355587 RepID=A0ABN7AJG7_9HEMI|nr:Hypothetical protein NTJ_03829 [Nesidiocoris tenuis]
MVIDKIDGNVASVAAHYDMTGICYEPFARLNGGRMSVHTVRQLLRTMQKNASIMYLRKNIARPKIYNDERVRSLSLLETPRHDDMGGLAEECERLGTLKMVSRFWGGF